MATEITATIGSGGSYDYDTVALALDALPDDLVALDENWTFTLYKDSTFGERVVVDGHVTDAAHGITFQALTGEKHTGHVNTGVRFVPTVTTGGHIWTILDNFVTLRGLELSQTNSPAPSDECIRIGNSTHPALGTLIEKCIIIGGAAVGCDGVYTDNVNIGSATYPVIVRDCVFWGHERAGIHAQLWQTSARTQYWQIVNCTIWGGRHAIGYRLNSSGSFLIMEIVNTIVGETTDVEFGLTDGNSAAAGSTLTTTGSTNNWDEAGLLPASTTADWTDSDPGAAGSFAIFNNLRNTGQPFDLGFQDIVASNDAQDGGVGKSDTRVSPTDILDGIRFDARCDPGAFHIPKMQADYIIRAMVFQRA